MESLPVEIIDKILFPKYYKCNEELTLNEKLYLSSHLQNKITVANQIKHLVKEFHYQCNRSGYNIWRKSNQPVYMYILYQSLSKQKNKEYLLDLIPHNFETGLIFTHLINSFNNNIPLSIMRTSIN
tara:strand:+ start:599 stop:976 length:378 start_codon:yes stop_codon:yes gene_type:complete